MKTFTGRITFIYSAFVALSTMALAPSASAVENTAGQLQCTQIARICKNGQPATRVPNSCEQTCPEDKNAGQRGACQAIREVCKSAGFKAGGAFDDDGNPDNGLGRDCMSDLLLGRTVAGISLNQEQTAQLNLCKQLPHPCLEVVDACDAARAPKGCAKKVATGKTVQGVVIPARSHVMACAQHMLRKENRKDQQAQPRQLPPSTSGGASSNPGL